MARIIKRICFITIIFLVAISIKVYANELTIDCQDSINPETENTLECVLKGNFTDNVNSIKVRYIIPDGVKFQGFTPSEEWNLEQGGTAEATGFILRINEGDVNGDVQFGKFTFSVPSSYNKDSVSLRLYELDATNTSCEIVDFDNIDVIKNIKIVKEDDDTSNKDENGNGNDETDKPSDDKNETDDGKDETDGNIEVPKDDNNSDGDLGTNNNSNNSNN
ncbi:MAG: hypothetical protein J6K42_04000, partial [Clostridia bacterium]|nr:hypothetical protein [Clostridia bacterium]